MLFSVATGQLCLPCLAFVTTGTAGCECTDSPMSPRSKDPGRRFTEKRLSRPTGRRPEGSEAQYSRTKYSWQPGYLRFRNFATAEQSTHRSKSGSNSDAGALQSPFLSMVRKQATRFTKAPAEGVGTPQDCRSCSSISIKTQVFCIPGTPAKCCSKHRNLLLNTGDLHWKGMLRLPGSEPGRPASPYPQEAI